jgi:hypothetical protein
VRHGAASSELQVGGRLKRRLSSFFAFNTDLRYAYLRYGLDPEVTRPVPFGPGFDSQVLSYHQVQGEASLRLNPARRRGNTVGRYLDLLAYGGWAVTTNYATVAAPTRSPRPLGGVNSVRGSLEEVAVSRSVFRQEVASSKVAAIGARARRERVILITRANVQKNQVGKIAPTVRPCTQAHHPRV